MKIFLTGGSGFVGQNFIPSFIAKGYEVKALVRSKSSAQKVEQRGAQAVYDDLQALGDNTRRALADCDFVVHSAAYMNFTYDPKPYYAINVAATKTLLELAEALGVKKFIYISAAPVVPGSPVVNLTEAEAGPGLPQALYPKTKALGERLVLAANSSKFQTIALRPPLIWGPDNHHFAEMEDVVKAGNWRWIGGGEHVLSTIHIANLTNATFAALATNRGGEAYFVTDGERRTMKSFMSELLRVRGLEPGDKILPRGVALAVAHCFGGIWKLLRLGTRPPVAPLMIRLMGTEFSISDAKARRELGYLNAISITEGMAQLKV